MNKSHQAQLQSLKQFRVQLTASTTDHELAIYYQAMPVDELRILAEERNQQNDHELVETGQLNRAYVALTH